MRAYTLPRLIGALLLLTLPAAAQKASMRSLEMAQHWLVSHQDEDGKWDCDEFMKHDLAREPCDGPGASQFDIGVTGLATLALLRSPPTRKWHRHDDSIDKAVHWLLSMQDPENGLIGLDNHSHFIVCHGIATIALIEAMDLPFGEALRRPAQLALNYIERHRNPYSVWRYQPRDNDNSTQVTIWMLEALVAGKQRGLETNKVALKLTDTWFDQMTDPSSGRTGYYQRGGLSMRFPGDHATRFPATLTETMTAAAVFGRLLLSRDPKEHPIIKHSADLLLKKPPEWRADGASVDCLYWYFGTAAVRTLGQRYLTQWGKAHTKAVVKTQRVDGSYKGTWDPIGVWGESGGRVYSTATLALTVAERLRRRGTPAGRYFRDGLSTQTVMEGFAEPDARNVDQFVATLTALREAGKSTAGVGHQLLVLLAVGTPSMRAATVRVLQTLEPNAPTRAAESLAELRQRAKDAPLRTELELTRRLTLPHSATAELGLEQLQALISPDPKSRLDAVRAIAAKSRSHNSLPVLFGLLEDPDPTVNSTVRRAWTTLANREPTPFGTALAAWSERDDAKRATAIDGLARYGPGARRYWPLVAVALDATSTEVRGAAVKGLDRILVARSVFIADTLDRLEAQLRDTSDDPAPLSARWRANLRLLDAAGWEGVANERRVHLLTAAAGLHSQDPESRLNAVATLAGDPLGPELGEQMLGWLLIDPNNDVQQLASSAIRTLAPRATIPGRDGLMRRLDEMSGADNAEQKRASAAARTLSQTSRETPPQSSSELLAAHESSAEVGRIGDILLTILALGSTEPSERVLAALASEARSDDILRQCAALASLRALGKPAEPTLITELRSAIDGDGDLRRAWAIAHTGNLGAVGRKLAGYILPLTTHPDSRVSIAARTCLVSLAPPPTKVEVSESVDKKLDGAITKLRNAKAGTVVVGLRTLGKLGPRATRSVTTVRGLLAHENPVVRRNALLTLGRIGANASAAMGQICSLLEDPDERVRREVEGAVRAVLGLR